MTPGRRDSSRRCTGAAIGSWRRSGRAGMRRLRGRGPGSALRPLARCTAARTGRRPGRGVLPRAGGARGGDAPAPRVPRTSARRGVPGGVRDRRARHRQDGAGGGVPGAGCAVDQRLDRRGPVHRALRGGRGVLAGVRGAASALPPPSGLPAAGDPGAVRPELAGADARPPRRSQPGRAGAQDAGRHPGANAPRDGRRARGGDGRTAARGRARGPPLERSRLGGAAVVPGPAPPGGAVAGDRDLSAGGRGGARASGGLRQGRSGLAWTLPGACRSSGSPRSASGGMSPGRSPSTGSPTPWCASSISGRVATHCSWSTSSRTGSLRACWWSVEGHWALGGAVEDAARGVPPSVRQLIERQLARLGAPDQRLLEAASVAGEEFSAALVAAALAEDAEDIEDRCAALVRHQVLRPRGTAEWPDGTVAGRYAFAHALYQEVLYDRVPAGRRVQLHRRIGRRLEWAFAAHTEDIAAELAAHFERGGEPGRAVPYLEQAARKVLRRSAPQQAVRHLERALDILGALPDTTERARQELAVRTALGQALTAIHGYMAREVEHAYRRARELCQRIGPSPGLAPVLFGFWGFHLVRAEHETAREVGAELRQLAGRRAGRRAPGPRALCGRGVIALQRGARRRLRRAPAGDGALRPAEAPLPRRAVWRGPGGRQPRVRGAGAVAAGLRGSGRAGERGSHRSCPRARPSPERRVFPEPGRLAVPRAPRARGRRAARGRTDRAVEGARPPVLDHAERRAARVGAHSARAMGGRGGPGAGGAGRVARGGRSPAGPELPGGHRRRVRGDGTGRARNRGRR